MSTTAETSKQVVGVIDIGTSAIRLVIAELGPKTEIHYLENLQKPVRFGKDVFTTGRLSNTAIREGIEILKNYKALLDQYRVQKIQAIATSAVREASNSDNFIDQAYVRAGIDVEVIEGPEENRLELIAVEHALGDKIDLDKRNCLIVEVGAGSTELIILNEGRVEVTQTLALGAARLPGEVVAGKTDAAVMQRVLKRHIHEIALHTAREYNFEGLNTYVALGGDMRIVAHQLVPQIDALYAVLDPKAFLNFVSQVSKMFPEDIAKEFSLPYSQAETLYPALLIYSNFLKETPCSEVYVPMVSIRDGILLEMAQIYSGYKRTDVSKQILSSARHLATKYGYDKAHVQCVTALALKLFDQLQSDHGMGPKERVLLEVAATLHDIGTYVSPVSHHKHSSYLVSASDIFGLRQESRNIVANVVRYHRGSVPKPTHVPYMSLPKADRAVVAKLSAILRVADALDQSHQQKIRSFDLEPGRESYVLWIPEEAGDISVERDGLRQKGEMFVDVFGAAIHLKQRQQPK